MMKSKVNLLYVSQFLSRNQIFCSQCAFKFTSNFTFQLSTEKSKTDDAYSIDQKLKCSKCDARFSSSKLVRRHFRTIHSDAHRYSCQQCGRRCRGPAELVVHLRTHSKEKPFTCDCGKRFAQKSQLNGKLFG